MSCVGKCIQFVMASRVACVSWRVMHGCYREIRNMSTIRYVAYAVTVFKVNLFAVLDVYVNTERTASAV
jgi:hypothetical protein